MMEAQEVKAMLIPQLRHVAKRKETSPAEKVILFCVSTVLGAGTKQ